MTNIFGYILTGFVIIGFIIILRRLGGDDKPSTCPKCKREYDKAEPWSYSEYSWGLRCPHCKHDFDITPS